MMKELLLALKQTIKLLEISGEDPLSHQTPIEIVESLNNEIEKIKNSQNFVSEDISISFLPTACIGDIAIFNGWGEEYIKLAEVVDKFKR